MCEGMFVGMCLDKVDSIQATQGGPGGEDEEEEAKPVTVWVCCVCGYVAGGTIHLKHGPNLKPNTKILHFKVTQSKASEFSFGQLNFKTCLRHDKFFSFLTLILLEF